MRVLIVEDEPTLGQQLKSTLEANGYAIDLSADGEDGHFMGSTEDYDAVILDLGLPEIDGLTVLDRWRKEERNFPVLVLTARDSWSDKVAGLDAGADDYLAKPFEPEELSLRCAAILRRSHKAEPPEEVEMSGLVFNAQRGELKEGDTRIRLTEAELQLLTILASNPGEPVSREELASLTSAGMERSVDVQVTRLRRKIEPNPKEPIHIQTVRGVGYRLMPD
ncbi:MAG: response regulator transcription factor [Parasphingorhabdus sp.]|uniref:response regulator transcription factor n=1 Tax=Parasphingorhabdus sp. TaxID=2709688 RepID=UPI003299744E